MTYADSLFNIMKVMRTFRETMPWNTFVEQLFHGQTPPSMQGVGGGVGVAPHAPKKNYFFAVFFACLNALLVGAPLLPGERIRSAGFPAATSVAGRVA